MVVRQWNGRAVPLRQPDQCERPALWNDLTRGHRLQTPWLRDGVLARPEHRRGEGALFLLGRHRWSEPAGQSERCRGHTLWHNALGGGSTGCSGGCGTVFSLDPNTGAETVLHPFGSTDGAYPMAGLIAVNGMLYGTTLACWGTGCGGVGCGTVFSIDPSTGAETVLYSFGGTDGASPS